jgi:acetylglutamate kinase
VLNVSRRRHTDELFAFGESASKAAAYSSLSAAGALPATRATARFPWPEGRSARRGNGLRNSECLPSSQIHSCQLRQNYNKKEIPPTYNNKTFFNPYHFSKKGDTHMVNQKYLDKAEVLIEALPYIQRFNRKIVVIKYGGSAMLDEELKRNVIKDAVLLKLVGFKPIIVHGGGKEISRWVGKVGMEPHFVNGLRVTDKDTMEIAEMVLAKVNKELVTLVESLGVQAVGVSGKDGGLLQCKKKLSKGEDIGYVGEVTKVNPKILHDLLERDFLPIVFPIGFDENFDSYNINADDAACAIAEAVEAEKLAFLSDIEGVYRDADDPSTLISELRVDEAENLISDGTVGGGMIPKLKNCIDAIEHGVNRVHILDGRIPHSLLLEIFTNKGIGTAILKDDGEKYYNEHE